MSNKSVLAFDFGASSGRAVIGTYSNGKIELNEIHRFSNDPVICNKTMYWDALRLLFEIKQSLVKAKQFGKTDSIGIDTWGVDFALLDSNGAMLENPVHYRDSRTEGMCEKAFALVDKSELYSKTGNQIMEINTAFQLLSLKEKRKNLLENADCMLLMPDLFAYMLTGVKAAEKSIASTTQLFNHESGDWAFDIAEKLGISKSIFPKIIQPGTIVGRLSDDICEELDVEPCVVSAVCGHDTQDAMLSVPSDKEEFLFLSCGTWSLLGTELSNPIINKKAEELNITNEAGFGGKTSFLKNIIGLWLIQESRRFWKKQGKDYSFAEMEKLACESESFKCFIDPDDPVFVPSGNIPKRIVEYCKKTSQPVPETDGEIIRCIYESLAMKYRSAVSQIEECTEKAFPELYIVGGGTKDSLLCSMTASACNKTVIAGPVEATVMGNIVCQLAALGEIKSLDEARQIIRNSSEIKTYNAENCDAWSSAYKRFKEVTKC